MVISSRLGIHVSTLAKVATSDMPCLLPAWRKAHGGYDRLASDFDSFRWRRRHDAAIARRKAELEELGYTVEVERANWFREPARGSVDLLGCPDIVARSSSLELIEDVKTGTPLDAHIVQVQPYLAVRARRGGLSGRAIAGRVAYSNGSAVDVPLTSVDVEFKSRIATILDKIESTSAPDAAPSFAACRFCDLAGCEFRIIREPEDQGSSRIGLFE